MKFTLILCLLIAGGLTLWSCNEDTYIDPVQLTTVRGRVLFASTQRPVRNASVRLSPSSRLTTTDSSGNFRFDSVVAGKYTLSASVTGYGTEVATVDATTGTPPTATILLTSDKSQNQPPTAPTLRSPTNFSTVQSVQPILRWTSTDPNRDSLTYSVRLYQAGNTVSAQTFANLKVDTLLVPALSYSTNYLWQVTVSDGVNTVNGPVWSFTTGAYPDYSYVFARRVNNQFQVFAADGSGSAAQLTSSGSNWRPVVSPNRQQIAYISNVDTDLQLYVMNSDGSNARRVTTVPIAGLLATDLSFCWSPDGTQLLYPSNNRLYAIRTDGTGLRLVAQAPSGRVYAGCDWTPQGNQIGARTTGNGIYDNELSVFPADGSAGRTVYTRRNSRVGNPVFSVDGRLITFSADVSEFQNAQGRQLDARLYLLDLSSGSLTDLSLTQGNGTQTQLNKVAGTNDLEPYFSPTGSQLIFTNTDNTISGQRSVYTVDLDGRNRKLLFTSAEMPYWRK